MVVTKWDEYLIHQTYDTIDSGEVEVDRIYLGCHNTDGTLHLGMGLGAYPKANIMDGYVCVRHKDVQHNLRLSRHLQGDRADTRIGPVSVEVIEPLKRWGLYVAENDYGIECSIEFAARSAIYMHKLPMMPFVHYNQTGRYTGSITLDGHKFKVDGFIGARDRSWRVHFKSLSGEETWNGHFWIQAHFPNCCLSLVGMPLWEGPKPHFAAAILSDDGSVTPITEVRHRIEFMPTVRALTKVELLLKDAEGQQRHVTAKPISPALYFTGAGYEEQGQDKGPFSIEGEQWDVSKPAGIGSRLFGPRGMSEHIAEFHLDEEPGVGILEVSYSPDKDRVYKPTW